MGLHPHGTGFLRAMARKSSWLNSAAYRLRRMRGLQGIAELDAVFREAFGGTNELTPEIQRKLMRLYLKAPKDADFSRDPFSGEYAAAQKRLYAAVADKAYRTENETRTTSSRTIPDPASSSGRNCFPMGSSSATWRLSQGPKWWSSVRVGGTP
jgi:hypothetical protein